MITYSEETVFLPGSVRSESDIIKSWNGDISRPLVSIRCAAFNHRDFIETTIKGFLIQETDFPIEIWIHDDASTDGTKEVIEAYRNEYPRIIKTVFQAENQYSKGNKPGKLLIDKCEGKYIAVCEGDDFWVDPTKLQTQVDFLESNPDYVISGHDAIVVDEKNRIVKNSKLANQHKRDYSRNELAEGKAWILTMSWLYRNVVKDFAVERSMVKNGDTFFISILGGHGKSHYHSDIIPAAHREHSGGVWSTLDEQSRLEEHGNTFFWMSRYYKRIGEVKLEKHFRAKYFRAVLGQVSFGGLLLEIGRRAVFYSKVRPIVSDIFGLNVMSVLKNWLTFRRNV